MLKLSPAVGYAVRTLGGWRSRHWREVAICSWELAPAETRENPVPLCIAGQLEKARVMDHEWRTTNLENLFSPTLTHKATTAHLLKDVELLSTSLFSGRMHHRLSDRHPAILDREPIERIASGVLASGYSGNKWFGHYIGDTCPMNMMASDVAEARHAEVVSAPLISDTLGQRKRYLELQEIKLRILSRAHFEEVVIIDPLGINAYHRAKMKDFRRRIRKNISPLFGNHNVYLRRGTHGENRNPTNEAEIESVLSEYGFHFIEPESMTLDAFLASMLEAKLVVGIEGSQLAHTLPTARDGATLLTLQEPYRFAIPLKYWTESIGMRWGFLIGHRSANRYMIDPDELRRTLDLVAEDI
jgi:capsular polysaccharide biosynthesis protein